MSVRLILPPIYAIYCDNPACDNNLAPARSDTEWLTREDAAKAGWKVRPTSGKGARTAPEYCPICKEDHPG